MSRKLNVASALLLITGLWCVFEGLMAFFLPEYFLDMWMAMMHEEVETGYFMVFVNRFFGLTTLFGGLLFCVICLIPYRKGEKWAWYAVLVIRGIHMFGMLILWTPYAPFTILYSG